LKSVASRVKLVAVDGPENYSLIKKYRVKNYPKLIWFKEGKPIETRAGRTKGSIINFVQR
jgi:hypothetical protein